ncbi:hypothetical protein A0H81_08762 [Grifola frondosa]|uniref:NAD(P)-binding protein n=1 Tax=Grifola frondosa TaxID=5627 RepID=A0A1C7M3M0_GRIFR|nr:hypothetical protein A0H81_08762 [Grifola frondosa]
MPSYAIIGSSKGIGLEYVRQLASDPKNTVFATVRDKGTATQLAAIAETAKNVHIIEADVVNTTSLKAAADEVAKISGGSLDVLIHNAAKFKNETFFYTFEDYESPEALDADFIDSFKVNVLGIIHTINAFLPLLRKGTTKKIVVIGAGGGDPDFVWKARHGYMAAIGPSQGASAVVAAKYAVMLEDEGFTVVSLCPGIVDTINTRGHDVAALENALAKFTARAMKVNPGANFAMQTPEESVRKQLKVMNAVTQNDAGGLLSHRGLDVLAGGKGGRAMDIGVYL